MVKVWLSVPFPSIEYNELLRSAGEISPYVETGEYGETHVPSKPKARLLGVQILPFRVFRLLGVPIFPCPNFSIFPFQFPSQFPFSQLFVYWVSQFSKFSNFPLPPRCWTTIFLWSFWSVGYLFFWSRSCWRQVRSIGALFLTIRRAIPLSLLEPRIMLCQILGVPVH